ncbi:hypothetical protein [Flavobacterium chungangense]|uniref:Uncharacterized protein n=1 Tax=Flavobacterium chungangense TaxID=554283 RepID=A0A6V6Z0U1_9FLAO|nr:hypothetical protein [Flavobacterium chungangense]CAD0005104.1 hypothetical protein FLACHUCJ7_02221 [Flavobacterium chungangense]
MKKYIIILLCGLIFLPSMGSMFVYANFKINQQEIARTICIQRKQIFNTCNGRCELQKSLKKYSDNEKQMQDSLKENFELVYICVSSDIDFTFNPAIEPQQKNFAFFKSKPVGVSSITFRPPAGIL